MLEHIKNIFQKLTLQKKPFFETKENSLTRESMIELLKLVETEMFNEEVELESKFIDMCNDLVQSGMIHIMAPELQFLCATLIQNGKLQDTPDGGMCLHVKCLIARDAESFAKCMYLQLRHPLVPELVNKDNITAMVYGFGRAGQIDMLNPNLAAKGFQFAIDKEEHEQEEGEEESSKVNEAVRNLFKNFETREE